MPVIHFEQDRLAVHFDVCHGGLDLTALLSVATDEVIGRLGVVEEEVVVDAGGEVAVRYVDGGVCEEGVG